MKRLVLLLAVVTASMSIQAAPVDEASARQVADKFFSSGPHRSPAQGGVQGSRLAFTAPQDRFYIYDRAGGNGGFVIVAGDDRLPQVLGYGNTGDFSMSQLPPAVQYWMEQMDRQIAYLQSNDDATVHHPAKRASAVAPLMTTRWGQDAPYNDQCPIYVTGTGDTLRAVTGCVATATAQVMNYHQWPDVGRGSHSYNCNVNRMTPTELSADFSQSVYRWELMLDEYDQNSSAESCEAVAKLMSDVGIAVDMGYGSSSGAQETAAMRALSEFFKYSSKSYLLNRDYFSAEEWDQFLMDELSAGRPIVYCGYDLGPNSGGHAFVFDGFNSDGYFHVNWGWDGVYDGYYLASVLNPGSSNFEFMQDAMMGVVPEHRGDEVSDVLYMIGEMSPATTSAPLGGRVDIDVDGLIAQGNDLDTAGFYTGYNDRTIYYAMIPVSMGVFNQDGMEVQRKLFDHKYDMDVPWYDGERHSLELPDTLPDGEYKIKLHYSVDGGANYDQTVRSYSGQDLYIKMEVRQDTAYLSDCFLANTYTVGSVVLDPVITVNNPFNAYATMNFRTWGGGSTFLGPKGNVYLSLLKDGTQVVSTSELCEVQLENNTPQTYMMSLTAPAEWGIYELALFDESGGCFVMTSEDFWAATLDECRIPTFVLPVCQSLAEDFDSMTANTSTSDKNVQGQFTTWSFYKSGVRQDPEANEENIGDNAVLMKKPSYLYTAEPLRHNFLLAQATINNPSATASKFKLEYSVDGGKTWQLTNTIFQQDAAEVPEKSVTVARWFLPVPASKPAQFRLTMMGGGSGANYVDDIILYYNDATCDVNLDGSVNIADVNAIINVILSGGDLLAGDVNGDGVVNIADLNVVINEILK